MKIPHKSPRGGFSLLEMTAAIFILCFGVMGIMTTYHFGMEKIRTLREAAIVTQAVQNEIETLRALPFDQLHDGQQAALHGTTAGMEDLVNVTPLVSIKPHGEGLQLKEVSVSVRWTGDNGRTIEKAATTLIADKEGSAQ